MTIATRFPKSLAVAGFDIKDPSLVLYFPLWYPYSDMVGSTIYSYDTNRLTGTVTGAIWGRQGWTFDGTDDSITAPIQTAITKAGTFTIYMWVNPSVAGAATYYLLLQNNIASDDRNGLMLYGETVNFGYWDSATYTKTAIAIALNRWSFVVAKNNGGTVSIYLDNVLGALAGNLSFAAGTSNLYLGLNSSNNFDYNGLIGEVAVFNRITTLGEDLRTYQVTKWRYT